MVPQDATAIIQTNDVANLSKHSKSLLMSMMFYLGTAILKEIN